MRFWENTIYLEMLIAVGVVGCPYQDIKTTQTVKYVFANSLTVQQAKDGVLPFATGWVATNYPTTV